MEMVQICILKLEDCYASIGTLSWFSLSLIKIWLLTPQFRVQSCGVVVDIVALTLVLVLQFSLQIIIPLML
jgi:hypothetical protein